MALLASFFIAVLMTLLRVLMTLTPRITRQSKTGLIFFSDIAHWEYSQWEKDIRMLSPQLLAHQVLEQVYATAQIADRKHHSVRQAIHTLIVALFLGLVLAILSQFLG